MYYVAADKTTYSFSSNLFFLVDADSPQWMKDPSLMTHEEYKHYLIAGNTLRIYKIGESADSARHKPTWHVHRC